MVHAGFYSLPSPSLLLWIRYVLELDFDYGKGWNGRIWLHAIQPRLHCSLMLCPLLLWPLLGGPRLPQPLLLGRPRCVREVSPVLEPLFPRSLVPRGQAL